MSAPPFFSTDADLFRMDTGSLATGGGGLDNISFDGNEGGGDVISSKVMLINDGIVPTCAEEGGDGVTVFDDVVATDDDGKGGVAKR